MRGPVGHAPVDHVAQGAAAAAAAARTRLEAHGGGEALGGAGAGVEEVVVGARAGRDAGLHVRDAHGIEHQHREQQGQRCPDRRRERAHASGRIDTPDVNG